MANWLVSGSEMSQRIREYDWSTTELGPLASWPQSLRTAVNFMLEARQPVYLAWGGGKLSLYNDCYIPIVGSKHATALGTPFSNLWAEIWDEYQPVVEAVLAGNAQYRVDQPVTLMDRDLHRMRWFTFSWTPLRDEAGKIGGLLSVATETTDRVLAERQLVESMDEGFCILEILFDENRHAIDYLFVQANASFQQQSGLINAVGKTAKELVPTLEQKWIDMYAQVALTGQPLRFIEHSEPMGKWFDVYAYRLAGASARVGLLFRDITLRKRAEEALREADRRKDEFLAMLAHELRNPLAPISAAADLLQLSTLDETRLHRASHIIQRQVRHMSGLIDDLLDVSRVTRGIVELDTEHLDVAHVINDAVEQVRPLISMRRHRLLLDLSPETGRVAGDRKRLVQVLANLLNNAARYSPEESTICVRTEIEEDSVLIEVIDNGMGMDHELVSRAFDLFSQGKRTADRASGGLGLGLSLVKSLVELHGGSVSGVSEGLGKGSRFTVRLPRMAAEADTMSDAVMGVPIPSSASPLRIMLVDDNSDAAAMLAIMLENWNHQVIVEHDSRRALTRAESELPQVILLDIGLPHLDGYELARQLRASPQLKGTILIAITGYGQERDRINAMEAGFDYHFVKPVDNARLAALLNEIGSGRPAAQ